MTRDSVRVVIVATWLPTLTREGRVPRFAHLLLRVLIALLVVLSTTPTALATSLPASEGPAPPRPPAARSARTGLGGTAAKPPRGGIYDPIGQLLAMVPDQGKAELFRFDPRGNIYEAGPGAPLRVYGKGNRLLRKGDTLYTWDDDG